MMGGSAINPCETWIKQNPAISFAGLCLVKWCSERDLNSHGLRPLPPQDSVSTNSTTRAFILFLFLIAEYHYFCFQLLEQLVVAVVELVQQFEINRQTNLFVRYRGEN